MAQIPLATATDLSTHTADTTAVHGVDDTAALLTTATKLDDLAAPDDNTDLDATTLRHGLLPKLGGGTSNFLRADGTWAAPAGGGASGPATEITETSGPTDLAIGAIASGQMLVRSGDTVVGQDVPSGTGAIGPEPGITADAQYVLGAATVTPGSTALSVTGGTFAAGDVGKLIVISRHRQVADAAITAADATLTSATAAFTADDVGAEVLVSGAGAGGVSLLTTIASVTNATTVELALAASTTVSGKVATIAANHATTIAGFTSATAVTLAAAPTPGFTAADVSWGTDQRAAIATAASAAASAGRRLRLPRGKPFVALDATNPWATTALSASLSVLGYGEDDTEVVVVWNGTGRPAVEGGLFRVGSAELLRVEQMRVRYLGLPHEVPTTFPYIASHGGGNATLNRLEIDRVVGRYTGGAARIQAANNAPSRLTIERSDFLCWGHIQQHFRDATGGGGTDHENHIRRSRFQQAAKWTTTSSDSGYNAHVSYIHPNIWVDWEDLSTQQDSAAGGAYALHHFGSPTAIPKSVGRVRGLRTSGGGAGLFTSRSASGTTYTTFQVSGSIFGNTGTAISLGGPIQAEDVRFQGGGVLLDATATRYATSRFSRCTFVVGDNDGLAVGWAGHVWELDACTFVLNGTVSDHYAIACNSSGVGTRYQVRIRSPKFYGEAGNTKSYALFLTATAEIAWDGGSCEGVMKVVGGSNLSADDQTRVHFEGVRFDQTQATIPSNIGIRKGIVTGRGCTFGSIAALPAPTSTSSAAFVPKLGTSGTSLTVSTNTLLLGTMEFAAYDITGGGTINDILAGDSTNYRRIFGGDLVLRANGASFTLAHNVGTNAKILTKSAANVTVADGASIRLRHDERAGVWYEV